MHRADLLGLVCEIALVRTPFFPDSLEKQTSHNRGLGAIAESHERPTVKSSKRRNHPPTMLRGLP
jgi:hypothetical protein